MNKRMKKKANLLRIYGREKIKKNVKVKLYVKPENWSETVWLFGNADFGDEYRMIHYGFRKEEVIRLLKTGYCSRDFEIDEGYVITNKNMVVLAVINNFDRRLKIKVDDRKKLCYVSGKWVDRTISFVTHMALDKFTNKINEPICIYDYLYTTKIKTYPECIKPDHLLFTLTSGEKVYVTDEECESFKDPVDNTIDFSKVIDTYGKPYTINEFEYTPKNTKSIYGVYEAPYCEYKNGLPFFKELGGIRNGKINYVWEPTDIVCTYYYADTKEEAMEEYVKTHPYESGRVYNVDKINKDIFEGVEDMLLRLHLFD